MPWPADTTAAAVLAAGAEATGMAASSVPLIRLLVSPAGRIATPGLLVEGLLSSRSLASLDCVTLLDGSNCSALS